MTTPSGLRMWLLGARRSPENHCYSVLYGQKKPCGTADHPCPLRQIRKTKRPTVVEHRHLGRDSDMKYFEIHCYPVFGNEGNVSIMIEQCLDMTRQKEALDKLAESETKYRRLFEL